MDLRDCPTPNPLLPLGVLAALTSLAGAQASVVGQWEPAHALLIEGVHAALLPTGKVLYLPHRESPSGLTTSVAFDPSAPEGARYQTVPRNYFCGGHTQLADGSMLFNGGETIGFHQLRHAGRYDPFAEDWSEVGKMVRRRWYTSTILLGNGEAWTFGGMDEAGGIVPDQTIERYDPATATWSLVGGEDLPGQGREGYNRLHLLPDGRIFSPGHLPDTYLYDPATLTWTFVATTVLGVPRTDAGSVRLQDGRVMLSGGYNNNVFERSVEIIDLDQPSPAWTSLPDMSAPRSFHSMLLLPDGKVAVIGGNHRSGALSRTPELFDPDTNSWTQMAPHVVERGYHSTALLLPDARVIVSSGEDQGGPGLYGESAVIEIWNPPYLFQGPRPTIEALPDEAAYGQRVVMEYGSSTGASHVVLHRTGSATHAFNFNQTSVPVTPDLLTADRLEFTIPDNPNVLPPGYYMAFLMDTAGVPSVARMLRVSADSPVPVLEVTDLNIGQQPTFAVYGGTPGAIVGIAYSFFGPGPIPINLPCGPTLLELTPQAILLATPFADANGDVVLQGGPLPAAGLGLTLWFDALQFPGCLSPPGVQVTIGP